MVEIVKGFPSTSQNDYQLNIINILRQGARTFAKQEIVGTYLTGRFSYTYEDAYKRTKRLANALKTIGAGVGDRVGVLDWNSHRNFEMYYGVPGTGSVMLLLNPRLSPTDLSYVVNHAQAKYIVVDEILLPLVEGIAPLCDSVKGFIVLTDKDISEIKTNLSPVYSYEQLLAEADEDYHWPVIDENSAYAACYTTGTTGRPKGVYYSHRDVYLHAMTISVNAGMTYKDCFFQLVPLFHALGWGCPHATILVGAKYVLPGMYNIADLGSLAKPLVDEKVTVSAAAPALLMPMLEYLKGLDEKPDLRGLGCCLGLRSPLSP